MSQYWRCQTCGAILKKGLTPEQVDELLAEGKEISGTATCGKCSSKFEQTDVYGGAFDVSPEEIAELVRKAREQKAAQQAQQQSAATVESAPEPTAAPEPEPAPAPAAAAPMGTLPPVDAEPDADDDDGGFGMEADPLDDEDGYQDVDDDDHPGDVLEGVNFGAPQVSADSGAQEQDPHRDFFDDLDAGVGDVDLQAAADGTFVQMQAIDDESYPRYELLPGSFEEFRPETGSTICCDVCSRHLGTPEGYLLSTDEVLQSADYLDFVMERWQVNGYLAPVDPDDDAVRTEVYHDLRQQAGADPWLVCENCILMFPHVRSDALVDSARKVREWWPAGGQRAAAAAGAGAAAAGPGTYDPGQFSEPSGTVPAAMDPGFSDAFGDQGDAFGDPGQPFADPGYDDQEQEYDEYGQPAGGYDDQAGYDDQGYHDQGQQYDEFGQPIGDQQEYDEYGQPADGGYDSPYDMVDDGGDYDDPSMQTLEGNPDDLIVDRASAGQDDLYRQSNGQMSRYASGLEQPLAGFDDIDEFPESDDAFAGDDPAMQTIGDDNPIVANVHAQAARQQQQPPASPGQAGDGDTIDTALDDLDRIMLSDPNGLAPEPDEDDDFMDYNPSAMGMDVLEDDDVDFGDDERH